MNKVRFAFYKPLKKDFFSQIISFYTKIWNWNTPSYSHVEIGFSINKKWKYFSSASKNTNSDTGTRWLAEKVLLKHQERWDIYEVKPIQNKIDMLKICNKELDKRYDWFGIFSFVTIFGQLNQKVKWYCSEICNYVFYGRWKKRISPRGLYNKLKRDKLIIRKIENIS